MRPEKHRRVKEAEGEEEGSEAAQAEGSRPSVHVEKGSRQKS